jgi:hypothetical protein
MSDLTEFLHTIDTLSDEDIEVVYRHILTRRQPRYWLVDGEQIRKIQDVMQPVYQQTDQMEEAEINAILDEALTEVRRERRSQTHRLD